ncbi:MAG TPA: AAA family ATPase [Chthoniobacterales bacterium]|jgi:predicted ATPase|nr:AAA family ATPase [Chthoniobacterales bacterium]
MRLDYLKIDKFKNLNQFEISFREARDEPVTMLLGRNGSGKSNLFEALVIIFRDLIQGKSTDDFAYDLRYAIRGGSAFVRILNPPSSETPTTQQGNPFTSKDGDIVDHFAFFVSEHGQSRQVARKDIREFLPRYVVTYYSGVSNRLEHHFFQPQLEFRDELLAGEVIPLRPLFYAKPIHSNFALLAFFMTDDPDLTSFLSDYPWIEGFESALFVLKRPHWAKNRKSRPGGDKRFWYAGGIVKDFLSCVYDCALAPLKLKGTIRHTFDKTENTEFLYLYLRDLDKLRELATKALEIVREKTGGPSRTGQSNDQQGFKAVEFFKLLESTFMSDLIHETRIRVNVRHAGVLTFRELSEGEQQLLTVVGMLRFTRDEDSLFLLDEPDTHLNPVWGMDYLNILKKHADTGQNSHLLVASHDPLVLSALRREQVSLLDREDGNGRVIAKLPDVNPIGLGVSGILRSEMFGLPSLIAKPVQKLLDRRFVLLTKDVELTASEKAELEELNERLDPMEFNTDFRDENFRIVAIGLARARAEMEGELTPKKRRHLEEKATQAARQLFAKQNP